MPFTPYHFGPNAFLGFIFRKWLDLPAIVLANVIVDVEVLFARGNFAHRHWHWHTLLGGLIVGAIFGLLLYILKPIRIFLRLVMNLFRIPYRPGLCKMVISSILGVWLHVIIDAVYHYDVQPFWPCYKSNILWQMLTRPNIASMQANIKLICLVFWAITIILYAISILRRLNTGFFRDSLK